MSEETKNDDTTADIETAATTEKAVKESPADSAVEKTGTVPASDSQTAANEPSGSETAEAPKAESPSTPDEELSPEQQRVKNLVITVLRTVFDPEIPVNIYELGLIYAVEVSPENDVKVRFTLTSPNCPAAQDLPMEMERKIKALEGIQNVEMELTWEPTWNPEMMTEAAKLQLNMF